MLAHRRHRRRHRRPQESFDRPPYELADFASYSYASLMEQMTRKQLRAGPPLAVLPPADLFSDRLLRPDGTTVAAPAAPAAAATKAGEPEVDPFDWSA